MTVWTEFVKKKANELNISYACALSKPEISKEYKESKKPKEQPKKEEPKPKEEPKKETEKERKERLKEEEYYKKQEEKQIKENELRNKIENEPENKFMFKKGIQPKLNLTNKMESTVKEIKNLMEYFKSGRKSMFKSTKQIDDFETVLSAIRSLDFYPTPERIGEKIANNINEYYRLGDSSRGTGIMDMCCGLASLSLPLIDKYMTQKDKIYLIDINPKFTEILKGLESENIIVKTQNLLHNRFQSMDFKNYYDKYIDVIISNPPFEIQYWDEYTPEDIKKWEEWQKKNIINKTKGQKITPIPERLKDYNEGDKGTYRSDKLGYLYFLIMGLDILENQHTNSIKTFYFICPMTLFKSTTGDSLRKNNIGEIVQLDIPKSTLSRILKVLKLDDKYEEDEDIWFHAQLTDIIDDFQTIRNGKPTKLGISAGLFEIMPYKKDPYLGMGLKKKSKVNYIR
jgi:predicted RNA methylase